MEVRTDHGLKLNGFYRGCVKQHLDFGKCKIFIPGVYPDQFENQPKFLPDAEQASPLFAGTNNGNGTFSYPHIGSIVWCFFENGDQNRPVYFAATLGGETAEAQFSWVRNNVNEADKEEDDTTLNGKDSQEHAIQSGGTRITLTEAGNIKLYCNSDDPEAEESAENEEDEDISKESEIEIDGNSGISISTSTGRITIYGISVSIRADKNIDLNAPNIFINASDNVEINAPKLMTKNESHVNIQSPQIDIDASDGNCRIYSSMHGVTPFY